MRRFILCFLVVCLSAAVAAQTQTRAQAKSRSTPKAADTLPLTTASPEARMLFHQGMDHLQNLRTHDALQAWRAAASKDPNCALAHLFVSYMSTDPAEEAGARARAKALAPRVTAGERLVIGWLAGVRENDYVRAIADMNDLLAQFPRDKRLFFLAGRWLILEEQYEQGQKMLERAIAIDGKYPVALNELGYAYAFTRDFDRAAAAMDRYSTLLPKEPNTQDSYGEIMRMAGRFDAALEHYRAALQLDPGFYTSQLGIADTYALMGEEEKARAEYAQAIAQAPSEGERVTYATQSAITYVRAKEYAGADKAFGAVAERAHAAGLALKEAQAHRLMSFYQADPAAALQHLERAEAALNDPHISRTDRDEERARIWRVRVIKAVAAGKDELARQSLRELEQMAASSRSTVIQRSYHAAAGGRLMMKQQYTDAIPHLEEDMVNAFSLMRLAEAYEHTGNHQGAEVVRARLAGLNAPTLEQAMVVPGLRAAMTRGKTQ